MSPQHLFIGSECKRQAFRQTRYALALIIIGASVVLVVGASSEGHWFNHVATAQSDGGSTVPIPPPDRPTARATNGASSETPTSPGGLMGATPAELTNQETGSESPVALWFGIGLGAVGIVGLIIGAFILVSSNGREISD